MSNEEIPAGYWWPYSRRPIWVGYAVTVVTEVALTVALRLLAPHFPIGEYPIMYVLVIMAAALLFGGGPAALALLIGFVAFHYYVTSPVGAWWPLAKSPEGWASLLAFLFGASVVGLATVLVRRAGVRIAGLARQLAEAKAAAESHGRELEAILGSAPDPVIVADREGNVVYANEAANRVTAAPREIGQPIETWIRLANVRELDQAAVSIEDHPMVTALRGERVSDRMLLIEGESGPDTIVSASSAPMLDADNHLAGAVLLVRNITPQKRLQDELERQRTLMEAFTQNVPVGLAFIDRDGRTTIANHALAEFNRVPLDEMLGRRVQDYLPGDLGELIAGAIQQTLATGQSVIWSDFTLVTDRERVFDVEYHPVRSTDGEIIGVGALIMETTEQVKARRELQRIYERERHIADTLQGSLLEPIPKQLGCFEVEAVYRAALEEAGVGGDFYDVFRIGEDTVGVVVGDVSGKGLSAAIHVAAAKYSIRGRMYESYGPARTMRGLNDDLLREAGNAETGGFMTAFVGTLDCRTRRLKYANCGHSPVMLWDEAEGRASLLAPTGPLVGVFSDVEIEETTIELHPGDQALIGTDGLYEVRCGSGFLDLEGVLEMYSELMSSGTRSAEELVNRVVEHCENGLRDDVAIISLRVTGDR